MTWRGVVFLVGAILVWSSVFIVVGFLFGDASKGQQAKQSGPGLELTIPIRTASAGSSSTSTTYVAVCGTAVAAGSPNFGASAAMGEGKVCEMLRVAAVLEAMGANEQAFELVMKAADLVDPTRTATQRAALWTRDWVLDPMFEMIPWVGSDAY